MVKPKPKRVHSSQRGGQQAKDAPVEDAVASAKGLRADEVDREDSDAKSLSSDAGGKGILVVSILLRYHAGVNNLTSTITSHQQTNLPASPSNQEVLTTRKWRHEGGKAHGFSSRPSQNSAAAKAARKAWSARGPPTNLQKDEEAQHSSPMKTTFPPLKTKPKRKARQRKAVRQA